jgi:hypothetical protein
VTRPTTRILWGMIGACLLLSIAISLSHILGLPRWAPALDLRRLEILIDVVAVLFWMLIFGIYWTNKE